jgi:hypothetical protein
MAKEALEYGSRALSLETFARARGDYRKLCELRWEFRRDNE